MATSVGAVRSALARMGRRGRTTRIPDEIRSLVMRYAREQRRRGRSWRGIAAEMGLSSTSLQRWSSGPRRARAARRRVPVVPVRVSETGPEAREVALVTPSGVRLEGLSLDDAVTVLRALA